ncbi:carotenoid oxygenase family protein [Aetokthonos hydrillicola Thurmond2011]|jgi:carotenoid cleavage dioxygenase-like enzyme|uniref:Carotenoid oxygenase family protein n=1 Tax=Aetokthonos hydrillicola Thurmond2011 TaxID=2712845 RepID=A0AAP5I3I0_9CYAN|nr:carotenoid oxygenase family protein [Aetokthonos hydrillicola]MBO3457330.1 lignostilbene-alpha,beta-dioxygenase [Aetokthonos hydrillicola CCALA 1050]MBW4586678.1 carotenoid oxygenase family protein [Aetokthonos hydrillicola CCALA 1050]MDR9893995.1 carotenoid oxygenase family protein [Aetokthonos hydrillicola Thurmond2011]
MAEESCFETQTQHSQGCPKVPESIMTASRCELIDIQMQLSTKLPPGLHGHVFMVAPVGTVDSGGLPYPNGDSLLCGDGMIYRLDFDSQNEVRLTTRLVKPPDYYADKATSHGSKYEKYRFRNHGITRFSLTLGVRNQLNTAFLPMKFSRDSEERLLVTYDGGRPYEIDTQTLEVVTPIGSNQEWQSELNGYNAPFPAFLSTAHPAFDPHTQQMFTVNYGRSLGNFLDTIPFIYDLEQLPQEIDEFLTALASFLQANFLKDIFDFFSQSFQTFLQLYVKLIEKLTNLKIDNFVYLICWDGVGALERWKLVLPDGSPVPIDQSMHQIGVTRDYVVLMDTAFATGLEQVLNNPLPENKKVEILLRDLLEGPTSPDSLIYIVRRADLKRGQFPAFNQQEVEVLVQKVVVPLATAHFLVDYDNPQGNITLHAAHICGMKVAEWVRKYDVSAYNPQNPVPSYLCGMENNETDIGRMGRYLINGETGDIVESHVISDAECIWGVDLYAYPQQDPQTKKPLDRLEDIYWCSFGLWKDLMTQFVTNLYKNYRNRQVPLEKVLNLADKGIPAYLFRLHASSTEALAIRDRYQFPAGHMTLSPQFIPRPDAEKPTDGYIICTVWYENKNEFWLFDANNLSKGPLCQLSHPSLDFGLTLHTAWLPSIGKRQATYYINVREDYNKLVNQASQKHPDIQDLFDREVYPHFE